MTSARAGAGLPLLHVTPGWTSATPHTSALKAWPALCLRSHHPRHSLSQPRGVLTVLWTKGAHTPPSQASCTGHCPSIHSAQPSASRGTAFEHPLLGAPVPDPPPENANRLPLPLLSFHQRQMATGHTGLVGSLSSPPRMPAPGSRCEHTAAPRTGPGRAGTVHICQVSERIMTGLPRGCSRVCDGQDLLSAGGKGGG